MAAEDPLAKDALDFLGESPAHCHRIIVDVSTESAAFNDERGDLFVTRSALVYIPYADAGWLAPGLSFISMKMSEIAKAAKKVRTHTFGMSVEDRIRLLGGVVMPKACIQAVSRRGKGRLKIVLSRAIPKLPLVYNKVVEQIPEACDGIDVQLFGEPQSVCISELELDVHHAAQIEAYLHEWLRGQARDHKDTHGVRLGLPLPGMLLKILILEDWKAHVPRGKLEQAVSSEPYMEAVTDRFLRLKKKEQVAIAENLREAPVPLREAIAQALEETSDHDGRIVGLASALCAVLGAAAIAVLVLVLGDVLPVDSGWVFGGLAALLSLGVGLLALGYWSTRRRWLMLLTKLEAE